MKKYKLHAAIVSYVGDQQIILVSTKINPKKDIMKQLTAKSFKLQSMLDKYLGDNQLRYAGVSKTVIEPVYVYDVSKVTVPLDSKHTQAKGAKIYTLQSGKGLFVYNDGETTEPTNITEAGDVTTETIMVDTNQEGAYTMVYHWSNKYNREANIVGGYEVTYPASKSNIDISHLRISMDR